MNISEDILKMFQSLVPTNPFNLTCNPYETQYTGIPCETTPPQNFTELGDAAVCGVLYDTTTLDANQCPTQYSLETFPDLASAEAAGATMTHWGACGVCSTTQDLAVYIEYTDLTTLGVQCSAQAALKGFEGGVRCYMRVGYTRVSGELEKSNESLLSDFLQQLNPFLFVCSLAPKCGSTIAARQPTFVPEPVLHSGPKSDPTTALGLAAP